MTFARPPCPLVTAAALLLAGSFAVAQTAMPAAPASHPAVSASPASEAATQRGTAPTSADRSFMTQAAMGGMAEVAAGRMAQKKASNDAVKQFGSHMVDDHSAANAELMALAKAKKVMLPKAPDAEHQAAAKRLAQSSGAQFDREYMRMMVDDHEKTVALFDKQASSGSDPDVKGFAAKTLPTLQMHLKMAKDVQSAAGPASGASR